MLLVAWACLTLNSWAQHVRTHTGSLTCIMRCVGKPVATALDLKDESAPRVAAAVQGGGWDKATTSKELLLVPHL